MDITLKSIQETDNRSLEWADQRKTALRGTVKTQSAFLNDTSALVRATIAANRAADDIQDAARRIKALNEATQARLASLETSLLGVTYRSPPQQQPADSYLPRIAAEIGSVVASVASVVTKAAQVVSEASPPELTLFALPPSSPPPLVPCEANVIHCTKLPQFNEERRDQSEQLCGFTDALNVISDESRYLLSVLAHDLPPQHIEPDKLQGLLEQSSLGDPLLRLHKAPALEPFRGFNLSSLARSFPVTLSVNVSESHVAPRLAPNFTPFSLLDYGVISSMTSRAETPEPEEPSSQSDDFIIIHSPRSEATPGARSPLSGAASPYVLESPTISEPLTASEADLSGPEDTSQPSENAEGPEQLEPPQTRLFFETDEFVLDDRLSSVRNPRTLVPSKRALSELVADTAQRQAYICPGCQRDMGHGSGRHPRLDHYTACAFCSECQPSSSVSVIPALVASHLHFDTYPVPRSVSSYISAHSADPLIPITSVQSHISRRLGSHVFQQLMSARRKMALSLNFLSPCQRADPELVSRISGGYHYLAGISHLDKTSINEIRMWCDPDPVEFYSSALTYAMVHISSCVVCRSHAHLCDVCKKEIYPFSAGVCVCRNCQGLFHSPCMKEVQRRGCPRCERIKRVRSK